MKYRFSSQTNCFFEIEKKSMFLFISVILMFIKTDALEFNECMLYIDDESSLTIQFRCCIFTKKDTDFFFVLRNWNRFYFVKCKLFWLFHHFSTFAARKKNTKKHSDLQASYVLALLCHVIVKDVENCCCIEHHGCYYSVVPKSSR